MKNSLSGKRVAVLGGTSGIGQAVVEAAKREGATAIVVGRSSKEYPVDLTDEASIRALFEKLGPVDHLVYTAGEPLVLSKVSELELDLAKRRFDTRVFGALMALKHAKVKESIVLTTGIAFQRPQSGWALGAAICGAMEGVGRALAMELAPVRVNVVSPGIVRTPLWSNFSETDRTAMYDGIAKTLPVRHVGEAEEVAETYIHLMKASFTTGQVAIVDGGGVLV